MDLPRANRAEEKHSLLNRIRHLVGEGKPLDETTQSQMESLLGHDLKEVRIHDSRQAGELAGRLGGEAFTTGVHIFGHNEKLAASSSQGAGLLAHEITHVVQQTKPGELSRGRPLERPLAPTPASRRTHPSPFGQQKPGNSGGLLQASGSSGMYGEAVQRQEEIQAQATEQAVRDLGQRGEETNASSEATQADPEKIADMVYRMMFKDLILERERRCRS